MSFGCQQNVKRGRSVSLCIRNFVPAHLIVSEFESFSNPPSPVVCFPHEPSQGPCKRLLPFARRIDTEIFIIGAPFQKRNLQRAVMATPPVKKAGLFGSRVSFRLQSGPSKTPRGSGDGAGDATKPLPPPPPPPPPPSRTVPSNPAVPKSAPSSSPPPQPLVPQAPLQLRPADEDAVSPDVVLPRIAVSCSAL